MTTDNSTIQNSTATPELSRLDTTSTTAHSPHSTYRDYCTSRNDWEMAYVENLYEAIDILQATNRLERLKTCRSFATFMRHKISGSVKVFSRSCNLRWCPLCAAAKAHRIRENTGYWLKSAKFPKFLTLTLKHNSEPLHDQLDKLYNAFKALRRLKLWKERVSGGIWFFQVTKSKQDNCWHPHLHVTLSGGYVSKSKLVAAWEKLTGDSYIVDIALIKDHKQVADYVARYATRPCNVKNRPLNDCIELFNALDNRRLCGTFGTAKAAKLTAKPEFKPDDWQNLGSWYEVTATMNYDDNAKAIWKAWSTNTALPDGVNLYHLYSEKFLGLNPTSKPPNQQQHLFN